MRIINKLRIRSLRDHVVIAVVLGTFVTIVDLGWLVRDVIAHGSLTVGYSLVGVGLLLGSLLGLLLVVRLMQSSTRVMIHEELLKKLKVARCKQKHNKLV